MNILDIIVFIVYFAGMLGIGVYFFKKNKSIEDYYVGGRSLGSWHIGLSVVATDVGGGFSIGFGGLKAVIYTDTVQWIILMSGLIFIGIPVSYFAIGGMETIQATLGSEFLSLNNVTWQQLVNWAITIIPIWFVGMTLYQRIYASKNEKQAKKAWFIAGLLEWPLIALIFQKK